MDSIFSTYSTGENRVTASILAVLRSLSLDRMERLLASLLDEGDFRLVQFQNQPSAGGSGVPDAVIKSSCQILIETKTERNAVRLPQVQRHLQRLRAAGEAYRALLILTPDDMRPACLDDMRPDCLDEQNSLVIWNSFANLHQAIDELLADVTEVISEREAFLLRQLQNMLLAEKLSVPENDVVVVAARTAWSEYLKFHAYICQPNRTLRAGRMAFYCKGQICESVPKILQSFEEVTMRREDQPSELAKLMNQLLDENARIEGQTYKVVLLSSPKAEETVKLKHPIRNDLERRPGVLRPYTMGHRYTQLDALKKAEVTSDLTKADKQG